MSVANHTGFLLVQGAVFTATITDVSDKQRPTVLDAPLGKIKVPCLIVHHKEDGCSTTPSEDVIRLARALENTVKIKIWVFDGGKEAEGRDCGPLSEHGFYGLEEKVVRAITDWMHAQIP